MDVFITAEQRHSYIPTLRRSSINKNIVTNAHDINQQIEEEKTILSLLSMDRDVDLLQHLSLSLPACLTHSSSVQIVFLCCNVCLLENCNLPVIPIHSEETGQRQRKSIHLECQASFCQTIIYRNGWRCPRNL